jgi:DNA invertase Pin-like site-specific DNA recombinase
MKIGFVRVSKQEQHEALQIDALKEAGCVRVCVILPLQAFFGAGSPIARRCQRQLSPALQLY